MMNGGCLVGWNCDSIWFQVFVRFGEVDSWMEDDEKTENQDICIWEREGAVWFGGDDDGKKTVMELCGWVNKTDM